MEEIQDNIDQLMQAISNMMAREVEADKRKAASTSVPPPVDKNPMFGFVADI